MISLGSSNFSSVNWSNWQFWVEGWSNQRLRVEGWSNRQIGGLDLESPTVSSVAHSLGLIVGINKRVAARHSNKGVANLVLGRIDVGIAIASIAKFILRVELLSQRGNWQRSNGSWGSSNGGWGLNSGNWDTSVSKARVNKA